MSTLVEHISCPDYQFDNLDLNKVSKCIDKALIDKFANRKVVIRGIQSEKHDLPKEQLVQKIIATGSDRYGSASKYEVKVNDRPIDLFGFACVAKSPMTLSVLEGFHKWKPMSLERPQLRADIWMVYDAMQLENVEYNHGYYKVKAKDGYIFKNPNRKQDALLGVFVID
ncbi:MAG TPA: hypothetical protein VMR16_01805 [Candidatus Saccharimonadales bacterium]|nr:hypothetical protein [Candidatus Saccharimonadales bacterium]